MKCSNHPDVDAVAICRACGRGICPSCLVFVQDTAACLKRCESRVDAIALTQARNDRLQTSFEAGKISDEAVVIYRNNVRTAWAWLTVLLLFSAYLIFRFVRSLSTPDSDILAIWLLGIVAMFVFGAVSAILKWKRLIRQRMEIGEIWRAR